MRAAAFALVTLCAFGAPALAQSPDPVADRMAREAELADQNRRSELLNVEINRKNAEVEARNAAARAAYEKAQKDHEAALAANAAEAAASQAAYDRAMARWEADVKACRAGDLTKCAPAGGR